MHLKTPFAELFGNSPIRPLQEHMAVSASAADGLKAFFDAAFAGDWQAAEAAYNAIRDIENKADELKRDLRLHLPKSLFLPVPRTDLLDLLTKQDKVANTAKDIAGLMLGRQMLVPEELQPTMRKFLDVSVATVHKALRAIGELDELLESGFSGHELVVVESLVAELDELETQADDHEVFLRSELYRLESSLPPVDVIFLYRAIEWVGALADRSQKVGSRLLLLLAR